MKTSNFSFYLVFVFLLVFALKPNAQTITTGKPTQFYTVGGTSVILAPDLTVSGTISEVNVSIRENVSGDVLTSTVSVAGWSASWDNPTKKLTVSGSGTLINLQTLLRGIKFSTTTPVDGSRTIDFIAGSGAVLNFGGRDHYYEVIPSTNISWTDAKSAAENRTYSGSQGYLATITSDTENDFIKNKVSANSWIGASDATTEGEWYWVTGPENGTQFWSGLATNATPAGSAVGGEYSNWESGEPNNVDTNPPGEDYGHILGSTTNGTWNDLPNSGNVDYYIVEYDAASFGASDFVTVNVTTNNPPVAIDDSYYIYQNTTRSIDAPGVLGNDTDADAGDVLSVTNPLGNFTTTNGSGNMQSVGAFSFTPATEFTGTNIFGYTVSDGTDTDNGSVTLTILVPEFTGTGDFNVPGNWNGGYVPPNIDSDMDMEVTGTMTTTTAITIRNLTITGTLNVGHNMVIEDLTLYNSGNINFSNGATITVNGDIYNESRKGIINSSQIILSSQIKVN